MFFGCSHSLEELVGRAHTIETMTAASRNHYFTAIKLLLLLFLYTLVVKLRGNLICLIHWLVEVCKVELAVGKSVGLVSLFEVYEVL